MVRELFSPSFLIFFATFLAAISGIPLFFFRRLNASQGQVISIILMLAASCLGLTGSILTLVSGYSGSFPLEWTLPFGTGLLGIDPLSAWFLVPIFLIPGCAALYARSYWHAHHYPTNVRKMTFFFGLMVASMSGVVLARDGISFLFAWEIMALAAYFLVTTEDEKPDANNAGTLYMISTHTGTLALFALFPLLHVATGSWLFPAVDSLQGNSPLSSAIFLTALFGFGFKAGLMPFHIWLPSAHANAPSHVSAAMSGVILKIGVYGVLRTLSFFHGVPLWWGGLVLFLGITSGLLGVAFAIGQHDLKRLLAYHSIENIGIIFMGIGIALIGQAIGSPAMILLGTAGALLHVLNHATFKALLFLGAGSVIHATGTRNIDLLGGAIRRLPFTALLFGIGAVAICGLPPLNGFVSELFILLGSFWGLKPSSTTAVVILAAPALAMIGGLAIACFVKVYGIVFLGLPRSEKNMAQHEAGWQMLLPMTLLAFVCVLIGLLPSLIAQVLQQTSLATFPMAANQEGGTLNALTPLPLITILGFSLLALMGLLTFWYRRRLAVLPVEKTVTWGCGYPRPSTRMQYTASSFAQMLTSLFAFILKPVMHKPNVEGLFPKSASFHSHVPEVVLDLITIPALKRLYKKVLFIRRLQNGLLQQYILYTLITLIVLLTIGHF